MAGFGRRRKKDKDSEKVELTKDSYRRAKKLLPYFRPFSFLLIIGFIMLLLTTSASLIFPKLIGYLVDTAVPGSPSPEALETFLVNTELETIDFIAIVLLVIFAAQSIFAFIRVYIFHYVTEKVVMKLRQETYSHIVRQPMDFFNKRRVGELNSRISADISTLSSVFTVTLVEFARQAIIIVAVIVILLLQSPKLTGMMVATLPVVAVLGVFFGRYIKKLSRKTQDEIANSNVIVEETFSGITIVKAFASELFEIGRYNKSTETARKLAMKGAIWRGAFISFIIFAVFAAIVFIVWMGVHMIDQGQLTIGELVAFIIYSVFIGASAGSLPDMWAGIQKAIGATENLMEILDEKPEDIPMVKSSNPIPLQGNVAMQNVSFHYPSREDVPVLKNVSFNVSPGEQTAIVGPSGSGKSTLISLLLRFYQPVEGRLLFDDKDAADYSLTDLRQQIGLVPQEVLLFGGTIRENIAYASPESTEEEIIAAAKKANAHAFISEFPEGYDTLVGERGIQLSGGQRQRVAIARAVLKDPKILILDEATSSLDSESERLVQEALDKLMEGRTSFVIAHRLSTIRNADNILVIDDGELKESGTHDDLIAREDGIYKHLSELQWQNASADKIY